MPFIFKLRIQHFSSIDFSKGMVVCKNIYLPDKSLNRKLNGVEHSVRCLCKHSLTVQPVTCKAHSLREGWVLMGHWKLSPPAPSRRCAICEQRADSGIHKTARQNRCVYSFNFLSFTIKFCWVNLGKTNSFLSALFLLLEILD